VTIQKKSLINTLNATKKAIVASTPNSSTTSTSPVRVDPGTRAASRSNMAARAASRSNMATRAASRSNMAVRAASRSNMASKKV
jgi:hypothetical protein